MTRFLKLVRHQNGSWQALPPAEAQRLESSSTTPPVTTLKKNAPIDPTQLLNALAPLLSATGGINSIEKAPQFASLMKKFSRKLVSRCVYCNVLKATDKEILSRFLNEGGWNTINSWLSDAKDSENVCFISELLELCRLLPMSVERLKENNTPKLVKSLTKFENEEVKSLSDELISDWMKIIKGDNATAVAAVKLKKKKPLLKEEIKEAKTEKPLPKPLKKSNFVDKKEAKKPEKRKEVESAKTERSDTPPKRLRMGATKSESSVPKTVKTVGKQNIKKESQPLAKGSKETSVPSSKNQKETSPVSKKPKENVAKTGSKDPSPVPKGSKEKVTTKSVKEVPSKQPLPAPKTHKRTTSESKDASATAECLEDVKNKDDAEPVIKRPKSERPKTVKSYQTKFRATGLEEEVPLPKKVTKKTPTVDKTTAAAVLAKTTAAKKLTTTFPDRITEKKIKPESLMKIDEAATPAGGIKLIPAKAQPLHVLHESASFMDALTAQPLPPVKRKKKVANKPSTPPTTPTSPPSTMKAPKLEFYKDTLEMNSEDSTKNDDEKSNDSKSDDKTSPTSPDRDDVTSGNSEKKDAKEVSPDDASQGSDSKDGDKAGTGGSTPVDEEPEEKSSNPNEIKSILAHGKRRLKEKTVRWVDDENLKRIHYFELDETERVNVLRTRPFGDLKTLEAKRERELFEVARRHAGDKMEESIPWWTTPIFIDIPPPLVEPGVYSQEREIQHLRQQSVLQEIYFNREMLPDSPAEPDPETVPFQEPKLIPLDEENTGPMMDYSAQEIPKPKSTLPEVLSSLIKMTTGRPLLPEPSPPQQPAQQPMQHFMPNPPMSQANMNPGIMQPPHQMNMHSSPASPFEVDEPIHPGLLGAAPPQVPQMGGGPPMFNGPPMSEPDRMPIPNNNSNNWRPLGDNNMMLGDQQFFGNFPPPVNPVMDMGMPSHMPRNMRPRMPSGPMMGGGGGGDMYRPGGPKGSHFRPGGPRRNAPRVPCRHFISGGCRFGINCNFLHPGVNGPL